MTKRLLIDATHPEETRVAVLAGNRLEDFDFETAARRQLKGNIYLAKITRVEPSLQAAFVDYGGNRHGFLAFSEIHPDYYKIPIEDREALLREQEAAVKRSADLMRDQPDGDDDSEDDEDTASQDEDGDTLDQDEASDVDGSSEADASGDDENDGDGDADEAEAANDAADEAEAGADAVDEGRNGRGGRRSRRGRSRRRRGSTLQDELDDAVADLTEDGGEGLDEFAELAARRRFINSRRYKIQEVIKRRQIMLVQVVKEERGNKGAALTTYISLAGRYCVLMPNTPRGGGISRKITNAKDRKRLKSMLSELDIPDGLAVIVRTAGSERSKAEIKRDYEYLIRLWSLIREQTLVSVAPALIHEEANLIKRSIRDLYQRDIEEVLVAGDAGYRTAKDFMKMMIPSHARRVQPYRDDRVPLMLRYQAENQIDAIHNPVVTLKSGGYLVLHPTEALVSIDVNSGRATRERHIEETAYRTNLEAAEEVARQLRLRDLAGLIVIDFIDMEESRNNAAVERKLKDALKTDRARIQIGRISTFGLMEMSRQRLRPSILEASTVTCPHCSGAGVVRTSDSAALHVLRAVEEEGVRQRTDTLSVSVATEVALYILNQKRERLLEIEQRYDIKVLVTADDSLISPDFRLERVKGRSQDAEDAEGGVEVDEEKPRAEGAVGEDRKPSDEERGGRRRRRRRRDADPDREDEASGTEEAGEASTEAQPDANGDDEDGGGRRRRRRGKRGGRRRRGRDRENGAEQEEQAEAGGESQDQPLVEEEGSQPAIAGDAATGGEEVSTPAVDAAADAPDAEQPAGSTETAVSENPAEEKPAPKPRRRRTRKTAEKAAETPVVDMPPAADEPAADVTPVVAEAAQSAATEADSVVGDGGRDAGEQAPAEAPADVAAGDQDDGITVNVVGEAPKSGQKRGGWWRRLVE